MYFRQILSNNTLYEVEEKNGELEYKLDKNDNKIEICKFKDVEFEEKNLFDVIDLKNGSEFPASYVDRFDVQGDIPLISAGAQKDIMGYIKSLKGNKLDEPNEHYIFNNTKK